MGEVINLNQFRKTRDRAEARRTAAANRLRHGRAKDERDREALEIERERDALDRKLIEDKSEPRGAPDAS